MEPLVEQGRPAFNHQLLPALSGLKMDERLGWKAGEEDHGPRLPTWIDPILSPILNRQCLWIFPFNQPKISLGPSCRRPLIPVWLLSQSELKRGRVMPVSSESRPLLLVGPLLRCIWIARTF